MSRYSTTTTTIAVTSRKFVLWSVLLVFLTFPHATLELGFKFGGADTSEENAAIPSGQLAKRHVAERKFKFRKIERIVEDDENDNDNDNDDDDDDENASNNDDDNNNNKNGDHDDNKAMKRSSKKKRKNKAANEDDDNGDDDEDISRHEARYERASADSSSTNEAEEWPFERVHKSQKAKKKSKELDTRSNGKSSKKQRQKRDDDDVEKDDDSSFFGNLFGWFGSAEKDGAKKKKRSKADDDDNDDAKSNSIIDWLQWVGKKFDESKPKPPKVVDDEDSASFMSYFDRWPFNSVFPIGKAEQPIEMPSRRGASKKRSARDDDCDDDSCERTTVAAPMSQDHFESLLHTLPGFVVNASQIGEIECKQQLQIFHRQLRGNKLWTLQMLDATGKISSGLLRGNINQFGDFDLCTKAKTVVKITPDEKMRIRGKYCLAHIEAQAEGDELKVPIHLAHGRGLWNSHLGNPNHFVPRYAIANWGVCIPHQCTANVVRQMIETYLRPYNKTGVEFHVEVDEDDCYKRQSKRFTKLFKSDEKFALTIFYLSALLLLLLSAFLTEYWTQLGNFIKSKLSSNKVTEVDTAEADTTTTDEAPAEKEDEAEEKDVSEINKNAENVETESAVAKSERSLKTLLQAIFKCFSPNHTLSELLSQERIDVEFPIFHLLKLIVTFMLYICLKYLMIGHLPITNRDKLLRTLDHPMSIVFRSPIIYTDILLMISGFLSAYQLSEEMSQRNYIQLLKRFSAKILRYLPTIYIVLCFQTWILPHLGSGPLWNNLIVQNSNLCEQQMWRNFFSVQNAIDFEETCSPMTIQLALEVQLFLLGPLIVWLYYTDADAGFFIYGAIHAMSVAARYARTNQEHLSMTLFHGINVSKFYRTANMLYSSPISRATPYLLGIGAAILYRSEGGNLDISPNLVPVGWILCGISIIWCFWSPSSGMRSDYIYSSSDAASYASWYPLVLGLALAWIIFMFPKNEQSLLRHLSTSRPVLFLSRISFPIQLVAFLVVLYNTASVKDAGRYHLNDLVNPTEICLIIMLAAILAFLIDVPAQNVRRLLVQRLFMERSAREQESDVQDEAKSDEHPTGSTPEPTETVWSSDPEEEEQRYLTRRRSSNSPREDASKKASSKEETEGDEEEDESEEIGEEAEVKRRPPPVPVPAPAPPVEEKAAPKPVFTRRRRPTSDD